jgi:hypothetical protein
MQMTKWTVVAITLLMPATQVVADIEPCRFLQLTQISFTVTAMNYRGDARVTCFDEYTNPYPGKFEARTWIVDETAQVEVAQAECSPCQQTYWSGGPGGVSVEGHCYRSRISGTSPWFSNEVGTARRCAPQKPPPDQSTCQDGQTNCNPSPVIVSLNHRFELTSADDGVQFDIDADGVQEQVAWTAATSEVAFLALDRNGNGRIDDGSELFGDSTRLLDGTTAANGFDAIAELDVDGDRFVTSADDAWTRLLLWTDRNHDGGSDVNELQWIGATPFTAIGSEYHKTGKHDQFGNVFRYQGQVLMGRTARKSYDVYLVTAD